MLNGAGGFGFFGHVSVTSHGTSTGFSGATIIGLGDAITGFGAGFGVG